MTGSSSRANANEASLLRVFTIPESDESTLSRIEKQMSEDLNGFLEQQIVAVQKPLSEIEQDFADSCIPEEPMWVSDYSDKILDTLIAHSVHTSSPRFIGHMTSALPYFLLPLSKMMVGLNQNLVKVETSKAFTPMERQVVGMLHNLVYQRDAAFYDQWMHNVDGTVGAFCSGGTVANMTALWAARNARFSAEGDFAGIDQEGIFAALKHYQYDGIAVVTSTRGHYSLSKAADLLGIGRRSFVAVDVDENNRIRVDELARTCRELADNNICILAIMGVAGTTETGNVDPLDEIATIAEQYGAHFHVDAAWGGATLLSSQYRGLMRGIERADSVTIDAHKQLYVPIGAGMVLFKDPQISTAIEHHAKYILREGSKDIGVHTLEGSRPGMAMLVHSCLSIIGRQGYELLIDKSLANARYFAELIRQDEDFELISEPELCLLTYRYVPSHIKRFLEGASEEVRAHINGLLNVLTRMIQKTQREQGKSFVSRTMLTPAAYNGADIVVFRVVLANPLTTPEILRDVLIEQKAIARQQLESLAPIEALVNGG